MKGGAEQSGYAAFMVGESGTEVVIPDGPRGRVHGNQGFLRVGALNANAANANPSVIQNVHVTSPTASYTQASSLAL